MSGPDFSPVAERYARARPTYPDALFDWLIEQSPARDVAWDCATGNGQAARSLAARFARVVASDMSPTQLRHAPRDARILYVAGRAERSPLASGSAALVTAAAAAHWFDADAFASEARRVLRPGGVLAVWTYHVGRAEPPLGPLLWRAYERTRADFDPRVQLVDDCYEHLRLPGEPHPTPPFSASVRWDLAGVLDFVRSWSGTEALHARTGRDPLEALAPELAAAFGDAAERTVRFPLYLRVQRF